MAGPQGRCAARPSDGLAPAGTLAKSPTLGNAVASVAFPRERDRSARTPTFTNWHPMDEATPRQKRTVAALIARTATPVTFDEASRLIRDLRRQEEDLPHLAEEIVAANQAGDRERLGRLLLTLKARVQHGDFARRPRTGEHKHRADHDSTEIERMKADKRAHLLYPNLSVWTDNKFAICSRLRSPLQEIRNQPEANRLAFFRVKLCAYHVVMARRRDKCAAVIRGRQDVLIIAAS